MSVRRVTPSLVVLSLIGGIASEPAVVTAQTPPVLEVEVLSGAEPLGATSTVDLEIFSDLGEVIWRVVGASGDGTHEFSADQLPVGQLQPGSYAALVTARSPDFFAGTAELVLVRDSSSVRAVPPRVLVTLSASNPGATPLLLLPAIVGILWAMLLLMMPPRTRVASAVRLAYALSVGGLWAFVSLRLVGAFNATRQTEIALLSNDVTVPSSLIVATFLGSVSYFAYAVYTRSADFFSPENSVDRERLLHVASGRLLIAPYVAMVGYLVVAGALPTEEGPYFAFFFGFFTGLFIKVVIETLNDIGLRLLSQANREKIAEHLSTRGRSAGRQPRAARALLRMPGRRIEFEVGGTKRKHPIDRTRLALRFSVQAEGRAKEIATRLGLGTARERPGPEVAYSLWKVSDTSSEGYRRTAQAAEEHPDVTDVVPVLSDGSDGLGVPTGEVLFKVRPSEKNVPPSVNDVLGEFGAVVTGGDSDVGLYEVETPRGVDPFVLASRLDEVAEVQFAEPDLIQTVRAAGSYGRTQLCSGSWDAYTDIDVPAAWTRMDGLSDLAAVTIAVIDDGVDPRHPDLATVLASQTDVYVDKGLPCPQTFDEHGTACAGLAVARPAGDGMRGVGDGCSLVSARALYREMPGFAPLPSGKRLAAALDWVVAQGADVISLSWSYRLSSGALQDAIQRAATVGRGGRGCIVLAAAGNEGNEVDYPANLPSVIAVGAVGPNRKLAAGPGWSSDIGPELDILAPGISLFTTAVRTGKAPGDPMYFCDFAGTSAACPIVAGAVGQMLRIAPELSRTEVLHILRSTGKPADPPSLPPILDVDAALKETMSR